MVECILHIGAGKCGSSSLQARLSANPRISAHDDKEYEYACLKENSRLLHGDECRNAAAKNAYGYTTSVSVSRFFTPEAAPKLRDRIARFRHDDRTPVLSYEGWLNEAARFDEWKVLENLGLEAKVIIFVRPQVEWINSSWWQWGAWTRGSFNQWLHRWKVKGCWASAAHLWRQVPGVKDIAVFTVTEDVVATFFRYINAPPADGARGNATLDGNVLRFLQQHDELRSGVRQSALHFILGRHLGSGTAPAPWVLNEDLVGDLLNYYRDDNKHLLELVDEKTRSEISSDPRWWDPSAYSGKRTESPRALRPNAAQVEDVAARAIRAILVMDKKLRGS